MLYRRLLCPLRLLGGSLRCLLIQIRHSNPPLYGMVIQPSQTLQNLLEMGDPCRKQNVSFPRPAEANQLLFQFPDPPGEETTLRLLLRLLPPSTGAGISFSYHASYECLVLTLKIRQTPDV
jgi:hypothetical protein